MNPDPIHLSRRNFLTTSASGLGSLALADMLANDGLLAASKDTGPQGIDPLRPKSSHLPPKAKSCIFFFMAGAPSQIDLFDPKPTLSRLHGQRLPESLTKNVRFAFIKETALIRASQQKFMRRGQCGTQFSELLPHIGSCADDIALIRSMRTEQFNHHPAQLMMQCGRATFGLPTMGSWLNYGLGNVSRDLPGYVVLTSGRGSSGGATLWQSGFLPSTYSGVMFRDKGEAVLNLSNPPGLPRELQRAGLDVLSKVNRGGFRESRDPEILSRIANYELAYRMQAAAPELIDLSGESEATRESYGLNREEPDAGDQRGSDPKGGTYQSFATNCLLARRLVERGVRFINVIYASWDHHSGLDKQLPYNARAVDQPIAALIKDLKQRGLLDSTLVVWGSEFGRTPLAQGGSSPTDPNTGRDHHPFSFSTFMAGGGVQGGQAYGQSDDLGWGVEQDPVEVNDFQATLLHLFGLNHLDLTYRFQGRDFRLTDVAGRVIQRLIA